MALLKDPIDEVTVVHVRNLYQPDLFIPSIRYPADVPARASSACEFGGRRAQTQGPLPQVVVC